MKNALIILSSVLAVAACSSRVPVACESDEAKSIIKNIMLDKAQTSAELFDINISKVITHDVDHETGNQSCEASISVKVNAATKAEWDNATATLDSSIVTDELGFPKTKHLPAIENIEQLLNVRDNDEHSQNMMILLSNTDYPEMMKKYLVQMSSSSEHPHFYFYLANHMRLKQLYANMSNDMPKVYPNITQSEFKSTIKYTTKLIKMDGNTRDAVLIDAGTVPISAMRDISDVNKIVETLVQ